MTTLIQTEIPDQLARQAQSMVERGWATDVNSIVIESLRRYLESHQEALTEQFIRDDVDWGLHGTERFIAEFAGTLGDDFPDDIDGIDLGSDVPRDELP